MIESKKELSEYIKADDDWLIPKQCKDKIVSSFACYLTKSLKKFLYYLRKQEYYINTSQGKLFKGLLNLYLERKKNKLGLKLGIEIGPNCFGKGLNLYNSESITIIISRMSFIENCKKRVFNLSKITLGIYLIYVLILRSLYQVGFGISLLRPIIFGSIVSLVTFIFVALIIWIICKIPVMVDI